MGLRNVILAVGAFSVVIVIAVPLAFHFRGKRNESLQSNSTSTTNFGINNNGSITTTRTNNPTGTTARTTTRSTTTRAGPSSLVVSKYSSALTWGSQQFCRSPPCRVSNYSFEAIEIKVSVDGNYTITCNSTVDSFGYLYNNTFDPKLITLNVINFDDDSAGNTQFRMQNFLRISQKYILVVTTYDEGETGSFSIVITGLGNVNLTRVIISNNETWITSQYLSSFTLSSSYLCNTQPCIAPYYFYETILLNVSISGIYGIFSLSNIDMFGMLYNNTFDSLSLTTNLLITDDDGADLGQFFISYFLYTTSRYLLVATTYNPNVTGAFVLTAQGYGAVTFTKLQ